MANHLQRAKPGRDRRWRLTDALNAKLAELRDRGFAPQWIEAGMEDLTRLVREGGEAAIQLDPDPSVDRAWFGEVEIRHAAASEHTWVFVSGEVASGGVSAHAVTPPEGA